MNTIRYAKATAANAQAMAALLQSVAEQFVTAEFAPEAAARFLANEDANNIVETMHAGGFYFTAHLGEELIGLIGIRDRTHIKHLFVAQACHGRGIARQLLALAVEEMRRNGAVEIVTVNSSNYAIAIYLRLGFRPTSAMQNRDGVLFTPMELVLGDI